VIVASDESRDGGRECAYDDVRPSDVTSSSRNNEIYNRDKRQGETTHKKERRKGLLSLFLSKKKKGLRPFLHERERRHRVWKTEET